MDFNPSKCQVLRVLTSRKAVNFSYMLHAQVLEVVPVQGTLGLTYPVVYPGTPTLTELLLFMLRFYGPVNPMGSCQA